MWYSRPKWIWKVSVTWCLNGIVPLNEGDALVGLKIRVGYLKETSVAGSKRIVVKETASGIQEMKMLEL